MFPFLENKKVMGKIYPFLATILFNIILLIILLINVSSLEQSIFNAFLGIIFGNFSIAIITQSLHVWLNSPHRFKEVKSVVIRSTAGILELMFYTFTITFGWFTLLAGFLFMKGLSVWKNESDPNMEGASSGILRIAVVASLFIAISISVYLNNSQSFLCSKLYKDVQTIMANNTSPL